MDLEHGSIASRDDFFRVLAEVQGFTRRLLGYSPDEPTLRSIAGQLEAMRRWTADGRTPRSEEGSSLDFGTRSGRALAGDDAILDALARKLFALQDYFVAWPSDVPLPPAPPRGARMALRIREAYQRAFRSA